MCIYILEIIFLSYNYHTIPIEAQLHLKQSSILKTIKVLTHGINDKHPDEDDKKSFIEYVKLKIMTR
jgi:hypothetical protein